MNIYAKVSKKGQVTIPKSNRENLHLGENSAILFIVENGEVRIKDVPNASARSLAGSLKKFAPKYESFDNIRNRIQKVIANEVDLDQN